MRNKLTQRSRWSGAANHNRNSRSHTLRRATNRRLVTAALFAALLAPVVLAPPVHAQEEASEDVKNPDVIVYVDGLACPFCAYGIEKKLNDLDATT